MKSKYTKGPWNVHWGEATHQMDELRIYGPAPKPNEKPIALVATIGSDFSHANAALIAAAPEMFEALVEIRAAIDHVYPPESGFWDTKTGQDWLKGLSMAYNAMRKVTAGDK